MRQNQTNIKKKHLRSIAKQVIQIYINHYRPIIPEGIYLNLIGMTDSGRASNPRPSAHGANALTTETPLR